MKEPKPKKCRECGNTFSPRSSLQVVCGIDCAKKQLTKKFIQKAQKEKRDWYTENKTIGNWKQELQKEINKIVRLIDYGQPCIATGLHEGKKNAGHYTGVGANDTIRFNLHNIHIQSEHSNTWNSGDTLRYQDGIRKIYGQEYLDYMDSLRSTPPIKLSIEQVREAIKVCKSIVKDLEKDLVVRTPTERRELREKLNNQINIYK